MAQEKKTKQLENELLESHNLNEFLEENQDSFNESNLARFLRELIHSKNLSVSKLIYKTNIEKSYFYQILNGRRHPSRDKIILIGIALKLTKDEVQKLLKISRERSLYAKDKRDIVIQYCILNNYDISKTQSFLENNGFSILE